ncbi:hypothetical protein J2T21_000499 [Paeniglutamicibacter psychrophenolicus]|nr:hypothetical protein [Paeniglutamicibacter psychrophenolicus]
MQLWVLPHPDTPLDFGKREWRLAVSPTRLRVSLLRRYWGSADPPVPLHLRRFLQEKCRKSTGFEGTPGLVPWRRCPARGIRTGGGLRAAVACVGLLNVGLPGRPARRARTVETIRRRRRSAPPMGTRPRAGADSFWASATASSASGPAGVIGQPRAPSPCVPPPMDKKEGDRRLLGDESPPGGDSIAAGPRSLRHRVMRWGHGGPRCLSPAASRIPAILAAWVTGSGSESNDPATGGVLLTSYEEPRREARVGSTPSAGTTTARHTRGCFGAVVVGPAGDRRPTGARKAVTDR